MISLDPFIKLAGNYSQKSGNPISDILISNFFWGDMSPDPLAVQSYYRPPFLLLRPWMANRYVQLNLLTQP